MMSGGDDSIPEPILNLRKKSAFATREERANNNDRKRPYAEAINGDTEDGSGSTTLLCQEVGAASGNVEEPPCRERPAVRRSHYLTYSLIIIYHHLHIIIISLTV